MNHIQETKREDRVGKERITGNEYVNSDARKQWQ